MPATMRSLSAKELAGKVEDLPALPDTVFKVLTLTNSPTVTPAALERAIVKDQALAATILKTANSAYYGLPRKVFTVSEAVIYVGIKTVRSIALTASTLDLFRQGNPRAAGVRKELWRQSVLAAVGGRTLAREVGSRDIEVAFTGGLLKDIGKLVLLQHAQEEYLQVWEAMSHEPSASLDAEQKALGTNHAEVGALVAEKWRLPDELVETVRCHHDPEGATTARDLTRVVHVAGVLTWMYASGQGENLSMEAPLASEGGRLFARLNRVLSELGLRTVDLGLLVERMTEGAADFEMMMG